MYCKQHRNAIRTKNTRRFISEREVVLALRGGAINHRKSEPGLYPCPKLVIDADVGGALQGAGGVKQTYMKKRVQVCALVCSQESSVCRAFFLVRGCSTHVRGVFAWAATVSQRGKLCTAAAMQCPLRPPHFSRTRPFGRAGVVPTCLLTAATTQISKPTGRVHRLPGLDQRRDRDRPGHRLALLLPVTHPVAPPRPFCARLL